ncbi:MAG: mechanosensitive ion channel family protein [Chitinophagales bacterium]
MIYFTMAFIDTVALKDQFVSVFSSYKDRIFELLPELSIALVVFLLFYFTGRLVFTLLQKRIAQKWKDSIVAGLIAAIIKWVIYLFGLFTALNILGFSKIAGGMLAGAGVSAFIIGFAFKDIAENFLSGLLLAFSRPFNIRDIIEVGGFKGRVTALNLRTTHIRTQDGRDIYIPNATIVKTELTNFTKDGLLRYDFPLGLDTECDTERARKLILQELKKYEQYGVLKNPKPAVNIEQVGVSTIDIRVFFWVDAFKSKNFEEALEGEFIKSRIVRGVVNMLLSNGYTMPSYVLEHKLYDEQKPLKVDVEGKK